MPKAISQLVEKNQDRFEMKKKITVENQNVAWSKWETMGVYVDLYDSKTETAYMVQKPVFNSDYKYSQILT